MLCTGGFGAQKNARGRTCYCISLYGGKQTSFYRGDVLGVIDKRTFRCRDIHHDGTNHYLYRAYKDGISEYQKDRLKEKLYEGTATRADVERVTRRLGDEIGKVYGWEFPVKQPDRGEAR